MLLRFCRFIVSPSHSGQFCAVLFQRKDRIKEQEKKFPAPRLPLPLKNVFFLEIGKKSGAIIRFLRRNRKKTLERLF
jgi:hypothetical protein